MFVSAAGISTSVATIAGSSGMTVPEAAGPGASVAAESGVGVSEVGGWVAGGSVGGMAMVSVASGGGAQLARMEFAAIRLPVTDAISFKASRRDNLPSV